MCKARAEMEALRRMTAPLSATWRASDWAAEMEQLIEHHDLWQALSVSSADGSATSSEGRRRRAAVALLRDFMCDKLRLATQGSYAPGDIWREARAYCQRKTEAAAVQLDSLQIRSDESVPAYVERGNQLFLQCLIYGQMSEKAALGQVLRGLPTSLGDVLPEMDKVVTFHRLRTMVQDVCRVDQA